MLAMQKVVEWRQQSAMGIRRMTRRRYKPEMRAVLEIRNYQRSTDLLIKKGPFQRLVKEVATTVCGRKFRFESTAILALQEAAESFLVGLFRDADACRKITKRKTLFAKDWALAMRLRGTSLR